MMQIRPAYALPIQILFEQSIQILLFQHTQIQHLLTEQTPLGLLPLLLLLKRIMQNLIDNPHRRLILWILQQIIAPQDIHRLQSMTEELFPSPRRMSCVACPTSQA